MVRLLNISKQFVANEVVTRALNSVNLTIEEGEFIAVKGPSGCGKSTLLNILGMLENPTAGQYFFEGNEVFKLRDRQRNGLRRGNIGFVFQNFNLIDELTVYENIELPLLYLNFHTSQRRQIVRRALERMNLLHRENYFPPQLSGGQQQRVAIARAIAGKPKMILTDEPTGNLDSVNRQEVMNLFLELNNAGTTIIMVTHSPYDANYAQRVINLFDGRVVSEDINEFFHL